MKPIRRNIFGLSAGEQAMSAALKGKKPSKRALKWMKEHGATTKKLKKSARREMQFSGRLNPDDPGLVGAAITIRTAPAADALDGSNLKQVVKDGVIEALKEAAVEAEQQTILDRIDKAAADLADRNDDAALDMLNDLLDDYDEQEEEAS